MSEAWQQRKASLAGSQNLKPPQQRKIRNAKGMKTKRRKQRKPKPRNVSSSINSWPKAWHTTQSGKHTKLNAANYSSETISLKGGQSAKLAKKRK